MEYGHRNISDLNPFFYGETLVHKPKSRTYQADALSANMQLNKSHYERQHVYRVEWEPPSPEDGSGGYVKWFTDGELVYGIFAENLNIMQTSIPDEPMYLIMNTAVATSWGFPTPCPENCDCKCYECGNPACACALPNGYCDNFPAGFEIDFVRVYQAVNESNHVLGCSPVAKPTEAYIVGHADRFMTEGQKRPLQPIRRGGGSCSSDKHCGGKEKGSCSTRRTCDCQKNWTGPNCLAHAGFFDVDTRTPLPAFYRTSNVTLRLLSLIVLLLSLNPFPFT